MGRYFGIGNLTHKQIVSNYWKADEFCDCHSVMHRYHWNIGDLIYSSSYCDYYEFEHDENTNTMKAVNKFDDATARLNNSVNKKRKNNDDNSKQIYLGYNGAHYDQDKIYENVRNNTNIVDITSDHAPIWDGNKCVVCEYVFDEKYIDMDNKNFDPTFCMN
ncbi:hypothetical protein QJ857_gp0313 [Tupanvirus soda lake]|uniref:Uncharacterized protein n=2 Tax=Tupanvirus TaxID=2094720 RepID=A0A6N1NN32_9VIRU|nr:hypothetical protein QJ857_gp0313 [Tupanvirus soda lake]QKU35715.1 hypothetical protein [Tupanvirus soda lake]